MSKIAVLFWVILALSEVIIFGQSQTYQTDSFEVVFPDANLEAAIRAEIGKAEGSIYIEDLVNLRKLNSNRTNIEDLTGIQYCENLEKVYLELNQITNVSPLSNLTNLQLLDL